MIVSTCGFVGVLAALETHAAPPEVGLLNSSSTLSVIFVVDQRLYSEGLPILSKHMLWRVGAAE